MTAPNSTLLIERTKINYTAVASGMQFAYRTVIERQTSEPLSTHKATKGAKAKGKLTGLQFLDIFTCPPPSPALL